MKEVVLPKMRDFIADKGEGRWILWFFFSKQRLAEELEQKKRKMLEREVKEAEKQKRVEENILNKESELKSRMLL